MPIRTRNTYSTPRGTYNYKKKTFTGKGKAPAGSKKVPERSYLEVPTTTVDSSGHITTSGFGSKKAARRARRKTRAAQRRVQVRRTSARRQAARSSEDRIIRRARRISDRDRAFRFPPPPVAKPANRSDEEEAPSRSEQLAEAIDLQVIEPAQRAGALPKSKTTGQKIADVVAETGVALAPIPGAGVAAKAGRVLLGAKRAEEGVSVAARAVRGVKAESRAGRVATRAKGRGKRNLAAHESRQAALRASRRIRPKAKARAKLRAKRYARDKRLRYGREGRKVARRNRSVKLGLASPHITGTATGVAGLGALGADISGHLKAIREEPGRVAKRTIEIAPGLVVSTADLAIQAAQALGTGNTAGLRRRIEEEADFAKRLASVMTSGDEKRVQRFVEENGLIAPLIAAPTVAKLGKGSIKRAGRELAPEQASRSVRRHGVRKQSAKDAAREEATAMAEVKAATKPLAKAYLRTGRRRKLRRKDVDRGDLVALAAEEGLTPGSARVAFPAVAEKWSRRPRFTEKKQGGVTGHDLVDLVRDDPGVWDDPAFWRAVDAYRRQEPDVRTSERVVDLEQAKTFGVQLAEDRPPPATRVDVPAARSRADVETFIGKDGEGGQRVRRLRQTIRAAEGKARELRAEARQLEKQDRRRGSPYAVSDRRRQQLLDVEADVRGMRAELAGTRKRHQAISAALRDPDQRALAKAEFDRELAAVRADVGLERGVYVPHTDVGREGIPVAQPITRAGKKVYERSAGPDSLAERGRVDYSLPALVDAGMQAPRVRRHVHAYVNRQVHEGAIPIPVRTSDGRTEMRRVVTREQAERGLTPEQKREVSLFPLGQFNQAVKDGSVEKITGALEGLGREIDWAAEQKGHKYIALDRNLAAEIKAQVSAPGTGLQLLQTGSRGLSRVILASPAWQIAQIVAESLQASLAINPLNPMNIYHGVQGYRGLAKMDPAKRREFRAVSGALPGMGASPKQWLTVDRQTHGRIVEAFHRLERSIPIKRLLQAVRLDWLRAIDRAKGGEIRVAVAAVKAHKDAMGFGKRLERLVKGEQALSERLAKMSLAERMEWAMKDTPAKRKVENYLDDVLGNWRALSRKERVSSPLLIFYPFLRMSLQWPFYSFPKRHPLRAAVMYELAASHNNQIRALLGGPPSWFSDYATAIIYGNEPGKTKTIDASRIVPGANAILEAVSGGLDVAAQRSLNPVVGYFNALINGIDPLTGEKVDPDYMSAEESFIARMGLVTSLLFNTAPPVRALDQLKGPKKSTSFPIVGPRREKDALGQLLEELNGTSGERALQTLVNPFPTADIDLARDKAVMGRIFEIWRVAGSDAQDAVINDDALPEAEKKRRLKIMRARSDEADAELHRLYRKYEIAFEAEEKKATEAYYRLKYPDEEDEERGGGNPYLDALSGSKSEGNPYLEALGGKKSKGNPYLKVGG